MNEHNLLTARDVCIETETQRLIGPVDFSIGAEVVGLVGANGSGKSSLAAALAGKAPASGEIRCAVRIGYLAQRLVMLPTVADLLGVREILDALARIEAGSIDPADFERVDGHWDLAERVDAALGRFGLEGLPLDRPSSELSGGERTRVALSGLVWREPELLILDEPSNHLDRDGRKALTRLLDEWRGGILLVSHDRELLERVDRIVSVEVDRYGQRHLAHYGGAYADFVAARERERDAAQRQLEVARQTLSARRQEAQRAVEKQQQRDARGRAHADRTGLSRVERRFNQSSSEATHARLGHTHNDRVGAAEAAVAQATERVTFDADLQLDLAGSENPSGKLIIEALDISFAWAGQPPLFSGLDFRLQGNERVALTGSNGSGKSTLARVLVGELAPTDGTTRLGVSRVAWLDQATRMLTPTATILETFRRLNPSLDRQAALWRLARLGVQRFAERVPASLSGGERMRAALACVLGGVQVPNLLVLDEPTNDLDLDTLEVLEHALGAYRGALLVVSHDQAFLSTLGVDRRVELTGRAAIHAMGGVAAPEWAA